MGDVELKVGQVWVTAGYIQRKLTKVNQSEVCYTRNDSGTFEYVYSREAVENFILTEGWLLHKSPEIEIELKVGQMWKSPTGLSRKIVDISPRLGRITYTIGSEHRYWCEQFRFKDLIRNERWSCLLDSTDTKPFSCPLPAAMQAVAIALDMFKRLDLMADKVGGARNDYYPSRLTVLSDQHLLFVKIMRKQSMTYKLNQIEARRGSKMITVNWNPYSI